MTAREIAKEAYDRMKLRAVPPDTISSAEGLSRWMQELIYEEFRNAVEKAIDQSAKVAIETGLNWSDNDYKDVCAEVAKNIRGGRVS